MSELMHDKLQIVWEQIKSNIDISQLDRMIEGQYDIGNGIYINVESYMTQKNAEKEYEVHRRYIDIQYIISGEEKIYVAKDNVQCARSNYDVANDIELLSKEVDLDSVEYKLSAGEMVVIMPRLAHKPCISYNTSSLVKKAVFKIPITLIKEPKYVVMDVDGTLTDGKIYMGENGECCKAFCAKDGYGIANILPEQLVLPIIITGRNSRIVSQRCKELNIRDVYQGCNNKLEVLMEIVRNKGGLLENVVYIGDDLNDAACMRAVHDEGGLVACPMDATDEIKEMADFISIKNGGDGAVREIIDWICKV